MTPGADNDFALTESFPSLSDAFPANQGFHGGGGNRTRGNVPSLTPGELRFRRATATRRRVASSPELERDFQKAVVELAQLAGWRVAHFRPAKTSKGWRTPVAADGAGFPDLVLVRESRLVVAELKSGTGRVSQEQQGWLDAFETVPSTEVFVWRPGDWDQVVGVLTGKHLREECAA
jgi:hypothetical protein